MGRPAPQSANGLTGRSQVPKPKGLWPRAIGRASEAGTRSVAVAEPTGGAHHCCIRRRNHISRYVGGAHKESATDDMDAQGVEIGRF